jgi:hypothetical protein
MKNAEHEMSKTLTAMERTFVLAHIAGASLSDAYRAAYSVERMKPVTVNRRAFDVAHRPHVKAETDRLWAEAGERARVTMDEIVRQLRDLYVRCKESGNLTAAIRAIELLGKTIGAFKDKHTESQNTVAIHLNLGSAK